MKKFIAIVMVVLVAIFASACSGANKDDILQKKPAIVDVEDFPEAQSYSEFEWPSFGISEKIPIPMWSNRGEIDWDTNRYFSVSVGYSTKKDFDRYVKQCYDMGYSLDYFNASTTYGYYFSAKNNEGYSIEVYYHGKNVVSIDISAPIEES